MQHNAIVIAFICGQFLVQGILTKPSNKWNTLKEGQSLYIDPENAYNWFEAMSECALRNMSLVTIDDPDKNDAILALLKNNFDKPLNFWIGGHDSYGGKQFVWSATGQHLAFTNWMDGRPDNNKEGANCLLIFNSSEWEDYRCTNKLGVICEEHKFLATVRREWTIKKHFIDQLFAL